MSRAARAAALVAVALAATGCGGPAKARPAPPIAGQAAGDPIDRLLAFVPADASYLFVRDQQAGINQMGNTTQALAALRGLRSSLDDTDTPGLAFVAGLLAALDDPARPAAEAVGWHEGQSAVIAYGLGLDTVIRASLDGDRLRATIEDAAAASRFPLPTVRWQGGSYYRLEIPTPAFTIWMLVRFDAEGVVAVLTGDPDRLLDHLMAEHGSGPRFDTDAVVAAAYPGHRTDARFSAAIYPERLGAALQQVVARHPPWLAPFGTCAGAVADLLAATPSMTGAWVPAADRFEAVLVVGADDRTVDRLGKAQHALPRWRTEGPQFRFGLGVALPTLLEVAEPWLAAFDRTSSTCGSSSGSVDMLRKLVEPAPMALIDAWVVEVDPATRHMVAALGARDQQALWAGLRTLVPLRPQPPGLLEQVTFQSMVFMGGGDALGAAIGDGAAADLPALMAAAPGPRAVLAFELGREAFAQFRRASPSMANEPYGSMAIRAGVRDRRLVVDMRFTLDPPP